MLLFTIIYNLNTQPSFHRKKHKAELVKGDDDDDDDGEQGLQAARCGVWFHVSVCVRRWPELDTAKGDGHILNWKRGTEIYF